LAQCGALLLYFVEQSGKICASAQYGQVGLLLLHLDVICPKRWQLLHRMVLGIALYHVYPILCHAPNMKYLENVNLYSRVPAAYNTYKDYCLQMTQRHIHLNNS